MAENSKIEWTHHTANLWHGCTKVHEGCDHCYAETLSKRWNRSIWGNDKARMRVKSVWTDLLRYQKMAAGSGEVHRVFVGSMMDIFEKSMPLVDSKGDQMDDHNSNDGKLYTGRLRDELFDNITHNKYPNLLFLFLTKRPSNINNMIPELWKIMPPHNVMFGTSISTQKHADHLVPLLLQVKGKRFLSIEPQLERIALHGDLPRMNIGINWIICGGESGHHRRSFNPEWGRSLRDECASYGVPFFMKQIDKVVPVPEDLMIRQFPSI